MKKIITVLLLTLSMCLTGCTFELPEIITELYNGTVPETADNSGEADSTENNEADDTDPIIGTEPEAADNSGEADSTEINEADNTDQAIGTEPENNTDTVDYAYLYDDVLLKYKALFSTGAYDGWEPSVLLIQWAENEGSALENMIGYTIRDMSGDGVPELLIGYCGEKLGVLQDGMIYALYTLDGETPQLVLQSETRNSYSTTSAGSIMNIGSNGAIYSIFGNAVLSDDGKNLVWKDFYYTHEVNGNFEQIGVYRNTTGETDGAEEELTAMTLDELWAAKDALTADVYQTELTPFSVFSGVGDPSYMDSTWIEVDFAKNVIKDYKSWVTAVLSDTEPTVDICIRGGHVYDLKILSLFAAEENDTLTYNSDVVYEYGELDSNLPLVITVTMYGDLPSWGISYTDDSGNDHSYAIWESGFDGSLSLGEY